MNVTLRIVRGRKTRISRWFVEIIEGGTMTEILGPAHTKKAATALAQKWAMEHQVDRNCRILVPTGEGK